MRNTRSLATDAAGAAWRTATRWLAPAALAVVVASTLVVWSDGDPAPAAAQEEPKEEFKVIPVKVNVLKGVTFDDDEIDKIVGQANDILAQAKIKLELLKTNRDVEAPPGKPSQGDADGTVDADQRQAGRDAGVEELKKAPFGDKGFKVTIAKDFRDKSGAAGMALIAGAERGGGSKVPTVHLGVEGLAKVRVDEKGSCLVHEFCHTFTLGNKHRIGSETEEEADEHGHSKDPENVMHEQCGGEKLTAAQIEECKEAAQARAKSKVREGLDAITPVPATNASWTDDVNDVTKHHIDLSMGFLFAEHPAADLEVTINLGGLHTAGIDVSSEFQMLFDADNNVGTGSTVGSFNGIDKILLIALTGQFPFTPPAGSVGTDLVDVGSGTLTPLTVATVLGLAEIQEAGEPPDVPSTVPVQHSIRQSVPLPLLGPLADEVPVGVRAMDLDTGEFDEASFLFGFDPPPGPLLDMSPLVGDAGTTVNLVGTNFSPLTAVTVLVDDTEVLTTTTVADGSFSASFTFPVLPPDDYFVTARDAAGLFDFSVFNIPVGRGGIAEALDGGADAPASAGGGSSPFLPYAAIAGGIAAAALAVTAGGWYTRRRWLR